MNFEAEEESAEEVVGGEGAAVGVCRPSAVGVEAIVGAGAGDSAGVGVADEVEAVEVAISGVVREDNVAVLTIHNSHFFTPSTFPESPL